MTALVAALPMYDWPEAQAETDAEWARLRQVLLARGVSAPPRLARRNADLPPVPGGIRDKAGQVIAPDPAGLPPDELDLQAMWLHPGLALAQACWGPLELGLQAHIQVVGQPDYSVFEGGQGPLYSSAILMRRSADASREPPPPDGRARLPIARLRGARFAFNGPESMSGVLALTRDLAAAGEELTELFSERLQTGSHRTSIAAVADSRADVCAVDCRSLSLARRFEPKAARLEVVGWTARRPGLPYIAARTMPRFAL